MFQLPIPIFDAEHSKGSAELGQLPDWNLNDLYTSTDAKELVNDLNWLEKECDEFAKNYEGKLKFLSADEMLKCVVRNEKISSISGRIISYAGLLYYQKTTDADRAKFLSDMQEKITIFTTKLVFFSLEINNLDDDFLESLLKENKFLLILNDGENKIGVIVDEVQGQQNVLLKQLGNLIEIAPFVIGCTILSNSKLVLILNVLELTQYNPEKEKNSLTQEFKEIDTNEHKRSLRKILVVDDSKMQRKRICEFLQIQGYNTEEAGDGFEALKAADKTNFSAFFVDIQMPLMD